MPWVLTREIAQEVITGIRNAACAAIYQREAAVRSREFPGVKEPLSHASPSNITQSSKTKLDSYTRGKIYATPSGELCSLLKSGAIPFPAIAGPKVCLPASVLRELVQIQGPLELGSIARGRAVQIATGARPRSRAHDGAADGAHASASASASAGSPRVAGQRSMRSVSYS